MHLVSVPVIRGTKLNVQKPLCMKSCVDVPSKYQAELCVKLDRISSVLGSGRKISMVSAVSGFFFN